MFWNSSFATCAADSLSSPMVQGMRHINLVRQSMTVRTQLKARAGGKLVTKSRVYEWNCAGGTGNGCNAPWAY